MLVIGHRGESRIEEENTPAAFRRAAAEGADGIELDVRLTPNGALVVHHDPLPDDPRRVARLPTFGEALDACAGLLVNVEIKRDAPDDGPDGRAAVVGAVVAELRARGDLERWLISSFSSATIDHCRAVAPELATALLVLEAPDQVLDAVAAAGHRAVHPNVARVDRDLVEQCRARGLFVTAWTCNDPARLRELEVLGVAAVCTDVPDVALAALGRAPGVPTTAVSWETPA